MRRLLAAAVSYLLVLSACAAFGAEPGQPVTVLSYNIHHAEGVDGKLDLERIARVIQSVKPDVVALQEVDKIVPRSGRIDQAAELGRLTGMRAVFGKTIDLDGGEYGNAVLSQLPVKSFSIHPFPKVDGREPRAVIEVEVVLSSGTAHAASFTFFATHFDYGINPLNRSAAVEAVGKIAESRTGPMILAGDLNAPVLSPTMLKLGNSWKSATQAMSLFTYPSPEPKFQIDHILFRPAERWKVVDVHVPDEPVASDHRPIAATLELLPETK